MNGPAADWRRLPVPGEWPAAPTSGRADGGRSSNAGSPTAPSRIASALLAAPQRVVGKGRLPRVQRAAANQVGRETSRCARSARRSKSGPGPPLPRRPGQCRLPAAGRCLPSHAESVTGFVCGSVSKLTDDGNSAHVRRDHEQFVVGHELLHDRRARSFAGRLHRDLRATVSTRAARSTSGRRAGRSAGRAPASSWARRRPQAA